MTEPADRSLLDAIRAVRDALRECQAPFMVIGGMAVIAAGVPRLTEDIDCSVWAEELPLERLFEALDRHGIRGRIPDAVDFARKRQVLLLRHEPSGTPMEVSLAFLPFEREALARSAEADFGGVRVPTAIPEDLVVLKAVAWRDKDRLDIQGLLRLHGKQMDLKRIRRIVREFAEILETPERVVELDALIRRVLPEQSGE